MNNVPKKQSSGNRNKAKRASSLTLKQKTQILFRKLKKPQAVIVVCSFIVLLTLSCITSFFSPKAYSAENTGNKDLITFDFVGDVMLGRNIKKLGEAKGYDKLFEKVTGFWKNADLVFANIESAVLKNDVSSYKEFDKNLHLWADYDGIEAARSAGINVFACANNHAFDYGAKAVKQLVNYYEKKNIIYSGIGRNTEEAASYKIIECNGVKIAFLSITEVFYKRSMSTSTSAGVYTTGFSDYNGLVYRASKEADVTIVYIHWGEENETSANDLQFTYGHQLIDSGADIVIGSHPHIVQEVELYGNGIIFYSLGNFIFDQGNTFACDSVMVEYSADKTGKGEFSLYPVRINGGIPYVTTNGFYQSRINRELSQSLPKDSYHVDENGFIKIPFDVSFLERGENTDET